MSPFVTDLDAYAPIWSPDGSRVLFAVTKALGVVDLYVKAADGSGSTQPLLESNQQKIPVAWTPDGASILFGAPRYSGAADDLWQLSVADDRAARQPHQVSIGGGNPFSAQLSPDGRWLAYEDGASGSPAAVQAVVPLRSGARWQAVPAQRAQIDRFTPPHRSGQLASSGTEVIV